MTSPLRRRTALRVAQSLVILGGVLGAVSCDRDPVAPTLDDLPLTLPVEGPGVPFPDSITTGRGLPPRVTDASTRVLGSDTLIVSQIFAFPAYSVTPSQVAPGAPTSGPMRINLRVFARDTSTSVLRDRPLDLAACPVRLRLYRTADRSGTPAWRSDAAAPAIACPTPQWFRPTDVWLEWAVPAILGDSLRAGRYYFAHTVRLADGRELEYRTGDAYLGLTRFDGRGVYAARAGCAASCCSYVAGLT